MDKTKSTIYSGIKATGKMHLGNYLGAVKNWVNLQESGEYNTIFAVADLHSITIDISPEDLRENTRDMIIDMLATGIDPEKSILYVQSHIKEHAELAWVFGCILPMVELEKMTQFKDKAQTHKNNINAGLLTYPALMAADILLYHANVIPVGEDQEQHVELARKIAKKFNNRWSETEIYFREPRSLLTATPRLMALSDPAKKMSKDLGPKSYISLNDDIDTIKEKIMKAVTDSGSSKDKKINGGRNLLDLFKAFVGEEEIGSQFEEDYKNGNLQYGKFKPMLANVIIQTLKPIQQKRAELLKDPVYIDKVIEKGKNQAQEIATNTMEDVRKLVGLD